MCDVTESSIQNISTVFVKIEPVDDIDNECKIDESLTNDYTPSEVKLETVPNAECTSSAQIIPVEVIVENIKSNGEEDCSFQNTLAINKIQSTGKSCDEDKSCNLQNTHKGDALPINNETIININGTSYTYQNVVITKKVYICNKCQYKCFKSSNVKRHIKRHQKNSTTNELINTDDYSTENIIATEKVYGCVKCEYKCFRVANIKRHVQAHKGCQFPDKDPIKISDDANCALQNTNISEKVYSCDKCDYKCYRSGNFNRHMKSHTGEKSFECTICNYLCVSKNDLNRHIKTHTGEKPYACEICNYRCAQQSHMKKHIARTHREEGPVKCDKCNVVFQTRKEFRQHHRTHSREKLVECDICHKSIFSGKLKYHIKTHTGEKPFKCKFCEYRCVEPSNLRRHMRKHTGEKPHKCSHCDYKSSCSSTLKDHIRTKHGGENLTQNSLTSDLNVTNIYLPIHVLNEQY